MALTATNLHLWRGERHVLRGVSFSVAAGEALHVRGANGSGKTSLLRAVCGLLQLEEGEVLWRDKPARSAASEFASELAYLGHDTALKGDLTALENLRFSAGLRQTIADARLQAALTELNVNDCAHLPCRVLSAGQRRRVAFSRVLVSDAPLWILDEPFTNLDVASSERISTVLGQHLERGGMLLIAAHQGLNLRGGRVNTLELD